MESNLEEQFRKIAQKPDAEIDLGVAALLIASTRYPDLDFPFELGSLDSMAVEVSGRLEDRTDPLFCLNTISEYLFDELGFAGNRDDYSDPLNSYINDVLDRRLGIPISLSLVYIEVGKRAGVPLLGVGMPMRFLVKHRDVDDLFADPFDDGILLSKQECAARYAEVAGEEAQWDAAFLAPVDNREFVARMMRNLKTVYLQRDEYERALTMVDWLLTLRPESAIERRDRGVVQYQLGNLSEARSDLLAYVAARPKGDDFQAVQDILGRISRRLGG